MLEEIKLNDSQKRESTRVRINVRLPPKLSMKQKFQLYLFGETMIRFAKEPGYSEYLPKYLIKCSKHGYIYITPRGYLKKKDCLYCLEEKLRSKNLI
jgi:hypothetical protein